MERVRGHHIIACGNTQHHEYRYDHARRLQELRLKSGASFFATATPLVDTQHLERDEHAEEQERIGQQERRDAFPRHGVSQTDGSPRGRGAHEQGGLGETRRLEAVLPHGVGIQPQFVVLQDDRRKNLLCAGAHLPERETKDLLLRME